MFNVGSVQGYLKLNTAGWTASMGQVNLSLKSLASTFTRMSIMAVGSVFLIEREFGKFDKAMRHATSVSETTSKEFGQMWDMALDASVKWNKAAASTAQAFYWLGSAGLTVTEQMQAFNEVVRLSRAMGSELDATVEGLVDVVRAFGLEFANTKDIADQLTKTVVSSNLDFQDLDASLSYCSSTARLTNNTLAETSAMLGIMADAGIKGCYDNQTEVLTRQGWKWWDKVRMKDEFATCNPNTDKLEYQKPVRLIRYQYKGKMYHVVNRGIDLCVTPEHRMWIKRRDHKIFEVKRAIEVDGKSVKYKAGGLKWTGNNPKTYILDGFTQSRGNWDKTIIPIEIDIEIWATFLGWYISEGSCDYRKGNYRVRISQKEGRIRDRMREVLGKLPVVVNEYKDGFTLANEQIWREIKPLGKAPQKYIPQYALDWSPRLLEILLIALMEGDGDCNEQYYTSSKRLADNITEIALKLGYASTLVMTDLAGKVSGFDKEKRIIKAQYDQWKVGIKKKQLEPSYYPDDYRGIHGKRLDGSKFPNKSEWVDYDGEVFCAEVPNHLLIVRRNGKIIVSGNSMAGTVLRRAMTNLMSPTGEMADLIFELGLNVYDSTGAIKPFIELMGDISDRLRGASEEYKNMVFEVLFGRRAIAGQITLFNYGSRALRQYADEIKNATGMTERVAGKQMKAFTEVLGQLWRETQRAAIEIGQMLAPAIERVANHIRGNLEVFREHIKQNKEIVLATMKWVTVVGLAAIIVPPLLLVITNLTSQFVRLAIAIGTAGVALATNPFTWLVAALYVLRTTLGTDFWKRAWENQIKPFLENFGGGFTQTITQIMWEISLIPRAIDAAFTGQGILNSILYFVKALEQIGIRARMVTASLGGNFARVISLQKEYNKLNEEMRDLLFGKQVEGGGARLGIFGSEEERNKDYQNYVKSLNVFGREMAFQGKEIAVGFGSALRNQVAEDAEALGGLIEKLITHLPAGMQNVMNQMLAAWKEVQKMIGIFQNEPTLFMGLRIPGYDKSRKEAYLRELDSLINQVKISRAMLGDETTTNKWRLLWKRAISNVANSIETWNEAFITAAESVRTEWATTIEEFIKGGQSLGDFLKNMFNDVFNTLARLASTYMANKLWYALFGMGVSTRPGAMAGKTRMIPTWADYYSGYYGNIQPPKLSGGAIQPYTPDIGMFKPAAGGGAGKIAVAINVENRGVPVNMRTTGQYFDGKRWVINAVMEEYNTNPNFRNALRE